MDKGVYASADDLYGGTTTEYSNVDQIIADAREEQGLESLESANDTAFTNGFYGNDSDNSYDNNSYELSPEETALRSLGYESGVVNYGGEEIHVDSLSSDEKLDIFIQALNSANPLNNLEDSEYEILALARENNLSLNELVEALTQERLNQVMLENNINEIQQSVDFDYRSLSDEQTLQYDVANKIGEFDNSGNLLNIDDINEEVERLMESPNKTKMVNSIKHQIAQHQSSQKQQYDEQMAVEQTRAIENQRSYIVNEVDDIDAILGISITDEDKNEILETMLEFHPESDEGNSYLMEEYLRNPKILFEAEYSRRNLPKIIGYYEDLLKEKDNEIAKAYSKGKRDVVDTYPTTQRYTATTAKSTPQKQNTGIITSSLDLYS